jgi:hypothetical protein
MANRNRRDPQANGPPATAVNPVTEVQPDPDTVQAPTTVANIGQPGLAETATLLTEYEPTTTAGEVRTVITDPAGSLRTVVLTTVTTDPAGSARPRRDFSLTWTRTGNK